MATCNVKSVTYIDKPTENYHQTMQFSIWHLAFLANCFGFVACRPVDFLQTLHLYLDHCYKTC